MSATPLEPAPRSVPARWATWAPQTAWQGLGLLLALLALLLHGWHSDGLWFLGDAPRHAMTGLFTADLLRAWPSDPVAYALSYYARYPVISPGVYPPGFYLLEGLAYLVLPPSPWVAKGLVLAFAAMAAGYTAAWARRWLAPWAGWAGPLLLLLPGMAVFANGVLLNVPATALGFAALYHWRRRMEGGKAGHQLAFVLLALAMTLTYYPAVLTLALALVWTLAIGRRQLAIRVALLIAVVVAAVLWMGGALQAHLSRNLPSLALLGSTEPWSFYARVVVRLAGAPMLLAAAGGLAAAALDKRLRREAGLVGLGLLTILACLLPLPATDERYALLALPLLALAAVMGPIAVAARLPQHKTWILNGAFAALVALAWPSFVAATVVTVDGFERLAAQLARLGPTDTVLYAGRHEANLGFYMRASDPDLKRRLVLASRLLSRTTKGDGFARRDQALADTPAALLALIRERCGCRWVAFEIRDQASYSPMEQQLLVLLNGPAFERVAGITLRSPTTPRVDLYRARYVVSTPPAEDLRFPFFDDRVFPAVAPVVKHP